MSRTSKWFLLLFVLSLIATTGWWLLRREQPGDGRQVTKVSLRLAWIPGATFAGDYAALQNGSWREAGLEVDVRPGGFEYDAIKLVAAGADTFGVTSGPQLLQARASGVPVVAIGTTIPRSPIGWVSKKASGITRPQDFTGKNIGAQFGTHTEITLEALCAKLGIATTAFQRIAIKFDPRPFVTGDVDVLPVYLIDQPIDLQAQGITLNLIDPADYGVAFAFGNVYFTTEETLKSRPAVVRAFLAGAGQGWRWAEQNRGPAVDKLAGIVPDVDRTVLRSKLDATFAFIMKGRDQYLGVFPMAANDWISTQDILVQFGNLTAPAGPQSAFTNEYLEP